MTSYATTATNTCCTITQENKKNDHNTKQIKPNTQNETHREYTQKQQNKLRYDMIKTKEQ